MCLMWSVLVQLPVASTANGGSTSMDVTSLSTAWRNLKTYAWPPIESADPGSTRLYRNRNQGQRWSVSCWEGRYENTEMSGPGRRPACSDGLEVQVVRLERDNGQEVSSAW